MRLQISLPPETWEVVKGLAQADRRLPRQQVEYLVIQAVKGTRGAVLDELPIEEAKQGEPVASERSQPSMLAK